MRDTPFTRPPAPAGFTDLTWKNDACPSYGCKAHNLRLWTDWENPDDRELPDSKRFTLARLEEQGGDNPRDIYETDDWLDMLAFVAAYTCNGTRVPLVQWYDDGADSATILYDERGLSRDQIRELAHYCTIDGDGMPTLQAVLAPGFRGVIGENAKGDAIVLAYVDGPGWLANQLPQGYYRIDVETFEPTGPYATEAEALIMPEGE